MKLDDQICYCYHVSQRKLVNFARREKPRRASQMSECLGAGTGCGWCIPFLVKIYETHGQGEGPADGKAAEIDLSAEEYADARKNYITTKQPKNTFVKKG